MHKKSASAAVPPSEAFLQVISNFNKHRCSITPMTVLAEIGIDSLETISLLVEIENKLGVVIPDEVLTPAMFQTVDSLWQCIREVGGVI